MLKVVILDGYVDEPTCLGVPPYISPYVRYLFGAVKSFDHTARVTYLTIDQIRSDQTLINTLVDSDLIVVVVGMSVPGKYLAGHPASPGEIQRLLQSCQNQIKVLTGPAARYGFGMSGGQLTRNVSVISDVFHLIVPGDGEVVLAELLKNHLRYDRVDGALCRSNPHMIHECAVRGAEVVLQHPYFPMYLIAEVETYRGCSRSFVGGCSFCSEPEKGAPQFRPIQDIHEEIAALYIAGVRHFRLGNQPCIFSYMAHDAGQSEFPKPNPKALEQLFRGIRQVAPDIQTLHIDNANPGIIARFPEECRQIAESIVHYHTSGDVAALGVESVDPVVIAKNNLKASAEEVMDAIVLLNEVGSRRGSNGLPELLPGLNFVFGLEGETKKTFELDYLFLKSVYEKGLLLRRINLRQVIPIPGTKMEKVGNHFVQKHKSDFQRFKHKVRTTIERSLLEKLVPQGTLLTNVFTEVYEGKLTFCRQLGSYPLLVGVPGVFPLHQFLDVKIVDYGYRSVTAVPFPLDVNTAPRETLEAVPGLGKKRVIRLLRNRPFPSKEAVVQALDDPLVGKNLLEYL
jgi:radical SAM superfamily enzyme with C-terminal helix-hairpin-helix motif